MGYDKDQGWSGKPPKDDGMTTVQITLPDQLAQEAERAGLLSSQSLEDLLRRQLKAKAAEQLFAAMEKMSAMDDGEAMTPEAVAEEIAAMRAERRANGRG
jgi:Arc/MetJ family transcription regulator